MLILKQTKKMGRGVFAGVNIKKGETLEIVELIMIPSKEESKLHGTTIERYHYFVDDDWCCIALGYGSLYNHSKRPNADWRYDKETRTFEFYALRDIKHGTQIFIDYGYDPLSL